MHDETSCRSQRITKDPHKTNEHIRDDIETLVLPAPPLQKIHTSLSQRHEKLARYIEVLHKFFPILRSTLQAVNG